MEVVVFIGIPATGKSSFYYARFRDTHLRLNLDMLRTRHRERMLFEACLAAKQAVVIDNTNVTPEERARYLEPARTAGARTVGYFFRSRLDEALVRNAARDGAQRIPDAGVRSATARLVLPRLDEGFDELFFVRIDPSGGYSTTPWIHDV